MYINDVIDNYDLTVLKKGVISRNYAGDDDFGSIIYVMCMSG